MNRDWSADAKPRFGHCSARAQRCSAHHLAVRKAGRCGAPTSRRLNASQNSDVEINK
jgi:hypothetical protein